MAPSLVAFVSLVFFCFIPRSSGSRARATRVFASDTDPLSRLNHTASANSTYTFLSATSPGFFLDLQISRHWSLVKVYGHKCAGASLYGVQLTLGGGSFEIVDGYDPSIPTLLDHQPTCIFSLSIDQREDSSLELYNLYDRRFGEYGTVTFSFAEYIPQDEAHDIHTHLCGHHIGSNNTSALLPRDGNGFTSTQPPAVIGEKTNIIIGLLTAIIIIVLAIFVLVTTYVLRLRRQMVLQHAKRDPEVKSEENQHHPLDKSIALASVTATETLQPRSQDQFYKDQQFEQPRSTIHTDPTSSLPTRAEITGQISMSRYPPRNDPPTSPPREPIPEVPKVPVPSPRLQPVKSGCSISQEFPIPPSTQYPKPTRFQGTRTNQGSTTTPASRANDTLNSVCLPEPAQVHNPDNSASQKTALFQPNGRHHSRFSKPLPEPLPAIPPLLLSPINHTIIHLPQSNGSSNDPPGYIDITKQHTGVYIGVRTVLDSSTSLAGIDGSNQLPVHPTHEYRRSLDNEVQPLRRDPSKTSLEHGSTITASGRKDTANSQDRARRNQSTQSNQHIRLTRVPKAAQPDNTIKKESSSVPLLDNPEEWLLYLQHEEESVDPIKNTDRIQAGAQRVMPLRISARKSARVETTQQRRDSPIQTHSSRRALPKPPY